MLCKLMTIGNLGADPEMRYTPQGQAVTSFTVASNRKYTDSNNQQVKETIWLRVSVWGKMAETCNTYLKKGSKVYIEGRLTPDKATGRPRIWQDKENKPRADYEVNATVVLFLDGKPPEGSPSAQQGAPDASDPLPF